MPTTTRGLPYPLPSDPPDGPTAVRDLAEATDALVPRAFAHRLSLVFSNSTSASAAVAFPAGVFSTPPVVVVSMIAGAGGSTPGVVARAHTITATGCTVQATHVGGTAQTTTLEVGLIALEAGPVSITEPEAAPEVLPAPDPEAVE